MITAPLLDSYLGLHIDRICPNGNASDNDNHCAHFVSHVLSLAFGYTCGPSHPACMRVHEIFARCRAPEALDACRSNYGTGILFVTGERNVTMATQTMVNVPRKHVGIVCGSDVWHYSNTQHRVVKQVVDSFLYHYKNQQNGLWLAQPPQAARAIAFETPAPAGTTNAAGGIPTR
ncbi:MAG: hypothetical protein NTV94_00620 [Planctomycetota bacterium]|nr:hypothetical protein [Planctomycetota bacterium]